MFDKNVVLSREKARVLSPVVLAFVGDAVYSLYVREELVLSADLKTGELQKRSALKVSAHGQSELADRLVSLFTEEESDMFRRGRNAKKATRAKNATVVEYNRATGFEAVLGFLWLTGQYARIDYLLKERNED